MTDKKKSYGLRRPIVVTTTDVDTWKDAAASKKVPTVKIEIKENTNLHENILDSPSSLTVPRIKGLKVLALGEDSLKLNRLLHELKNLGVNAVASNISADGYRNALRFQPDVIISGLISPGKPGWELLQKFRRHPILRWTPILMMRWWKEVPGGEGEVLTALVTERLGEALTSTRVIEERIAAGRSLGDQVELTGVLGALKTIVNSGLSGMFLLNDSWNIFEAVVRNRKIVFAHRRGVDGTKDLGKRAFLQLLMSDAGNWTFRDIGDRHVIENIMSSFQDLVNYTMIAASDLFGPDAFVKPKTAKRLAIRAAIFRDIGSTMTGPGRKITEMIGAGASNEKIDSFIGSQNDRLDVEHALIALVRCGAVLFDALPDEADKNAKTHLMKQGTVHIFELVREDYRKSGRKLATLVTDNAIPKQVPKQIPTQVPKQISKTGGYYQLTEMQPEHISVASINNLKLPGTRYPSETKALDDTPMNSNLQDRPTPVLSVKDSAWRREFPGIPDGEESAFSSVLPHDSLVPSPHAQERRGKKQMWLAVAMALILSGLLVATLVVLGSDTRPTTPINIKN